MLEFFSSLLIETRQTGPLGVAVLLSFVMVVAALVLSTIRLLRGPTLPDRVVALDLISILLVALLTLFAISSQVDAYLDAAIVLALVAFLGTVALARFVLRSGRNYKSGTPMPPGEERP
ncbi:multiple resistance and pH regulation protein F [Dinoroseobacter shibae DFL 12 = DSM 16493]|uniref:Multiple resistance and pH regulation protein F n=1 Tax=Dinoroseobacter shibae (strain DSM 16493 / NCIMB 14021 / DFL 12) TaxID=398580 RepID=A8LQT5_DINSH|nr:MULTISPECIES: cation:proton antiporter [Dinoroseobacter]ABV92478.1 multiple resistance and pH regulation protein F [Dinoroseobacter shibae DFL 12 = DSM 16493]MDD9718261.1 cation:proton antiporter [Dinoroseobacter sp. PD6]URF47422.1 cation:proton antiporter [Dinoroseobacter shibae]URF51733.1 cation:proton antiporter [Dinoroseobacter shibae]